MADRKFNIIGEKRTLFKPSRTIGQFINYEKTNRMCA